MTESKPTSEDTSFIGRGGNRKAGGGDGSLDGRSESEGLPIRLRSSRWPNLGRERALVLGQSVEAEFCLGPAESVGTTSDLENQVTVLGERCPAIFLSTDGRCKQGQEGRD